MLDIIIEKINTRIDNVTNRVVRLEKIPVPEVEAWQTPTLLNGWVNYGGAYNPSGYYKDPYGVVRLRGLVKSGTTTFDTAIFTLPVGYRPEAESGFAVANSGAFGEIRIASNGNVKIASGGNGYLFLDSIFFRAV